MVTQNKKERMSLDSNGENDQLTWRTNDSFMKINKTIKQNDHMSSDDTITPIAHEQATYDTEVRCIFECVNTVMWLTHTN